MSASEGTSLEQAFSIAYDAIRKKADQLRTGPSISPTTLVHEAYLRLAQLADQEGWTPLRVRAVAARAMHSVLVDRVRRRESFKRGGDWYRVTLAGVAGPVEVPIEDLHDALGRLQAEAPEAFQVVELRFFGGLTNAEAAEVLGLSLRTVERRWRAARALLRALMGDA